MRQTLVICALLLLAALAVGQTNNGGAPVLVAPAVTYAAPYGGLLIQGGYATTVGLSNPPLLVTPTASLSTVSANPIGASNATSNLQAGATNSTLDSVTTALPATQTALEVNLPGAMLPMGYFQPAPQAVEAESPGTTLGAAQFDVVNARGPGDHRSLAEMARVIRQQPKPASVRTFTNADLQNLRDREKSAPKPQ